MISGTVTFKVGDDVFEAGPADRGADRRGEAFRSVHNDTDDEAELLIFSPRLAVNAMGATAPDPSLTERGQLLEALLRALQGRGSVAGRERRRQGAEARVDGRRRPLPPDHAGVVRRGCALGARGDRRGRRAPRLLDLRLAALRARRPGPAAAADGAACARRLQRGGAARPGGAHDRPRALRARLDGDAARRRHACRSVAADRARSTPRHRGPQYDHRGRPRAGRPGPPCHQDGSARVPHRHRRPGLLAPVKPFGRRSGPTSSRSTPARCLNDCWSRR